MVKLTLPGMVELAIVRPRVLFAPAKAGQEDASATGFCVAAMLVQAELMNSLSFTSSSDRLQVPLGRGRF